MKCQSLFFLVQNNPVVSSLKASSNKDTSSCSKSQPCTRKRTIEGKGKGRGKGKGKKKMETCDKDNTDTSVCSVYRRHYAEGELWIQCDLCDEWFDWFCQGIDENTWSSTENEKWFCTKCS
ncbi:hypothetical protein ACJMK2_004105 [Sinanodonta woodiana]|uniref:Zinc finger PHD-type domain-containing protein n=1 Tax=Sinanodonta woodiana TaxID=1069815 RepID=A0ABD3Y072_SINWO